MAEALLVLQNRNIIRSCGNDDFVLVRDLHNLSLQDLVDCLDIAQPLAGDFDSLPDIILEHFPKLETLKQRFAVIEDTNRKTLCQSLAECFEAEEGLKQDLKIRSN